jgi:hypothetical protein
MNAQGLLVEGPKGEKFLLTTEPHLEMKTHRLVVMQRLNGKWEHMKEIQELACREALIGAFVDLLVDICRVLNSFDSDRIVAMAPTSGRSRPRRAFPLKVQKGL